MLLLWITVARIVVLARQCNMDFAATATHIAAAAARLQDRTARVEHRSGLIDCVAYGRAGTDSRCLAQWSAFTKSGGKPGASSSKAGSKGEASPLPAAVQS
jgi:hypothetical protein